jgi:hypothetical protein
MFVTTICTSHVKNKMTETKPAVSGTARQAPALLRGSGEGGGALGDAYRWVGIGRDNV